MTDGTRAFDDALALYKQGRVDDAAAGFQAALRIDPTHVPALCCLGLCRLQRGEALEALRLGRLASALDCRSAEAWHSLGNAHAALADHQAAAVSFRRMLAIRPDFAEGYSNLGNALTALRRWDEAQACYDETLRLKPDYAEASYNLGIVLVTLADWREAATAFTRAALCKPGLVGVHHQLAIALQELDRHREALAALDRASVLTPDVIDIRYRQANSLSNLSQPQEAIALYRNVLTRQPDHAEAHNNLGVARQALSQPTEALGDHSTAIVLQPDYAHSYNNRGSALHALDRIDDALLCYRRAARLSPDDAVAHNNVGIALLENGRIDDAARAFEKAVTLAPRRGFFYRTLADTGRVTPDSALWRKIEELALDIESLPAADRMELHFALGKIYGDAGEVKKSFLHLLSGNRLKRDSIDYDEKATLAMFERIEAVFTRELLGEWSGADRIHDLPVFVVGMPRSGTTLVEQVLASHSQIAGVGEILDLRRLTNQLTTAGDAAAFPEIITSLPNADLRQLGDHYRDLLRARAPTAARIVDKMPANFQLIGLIRLALPNARLIHVRRDPIDSCLSAFSKLFAGQQPFSYDLAELGTYYRAYERLMAHWRRVLPAGVMLEIDYEEVVRDIDGQARRLVAHCGLPWDENCLAFHLTRRPVRTASATQVRRPLYTDAVGRWHIYRKLASPLFDALKDQDE